MEWTFLRHPNRIERKGSEGQYTLEIESFYSRHVQNKIKKFDFLITSLLWQGKFTILYLYCLLVAINYSGMSQLRTHRHARTHQHTHRHTYTRTRTHMSRRTHTRVRIHACTHAVTHARTHARSNPRTCTRSYVCTHSRIHARTHAFMHALTQSCKQEGSQAIRLDLTQTHIQTRAQKHRHTETLWTTRQQHSKTKTHTRMPYLLLSLIYSTSYHLLIVLFDL